jgi:hypothetical protein
MPVCAAAAARRAAFGVLRGLDGTLAQRTNEKDAADQNWRLGTVPREALMPPLEIKHKHQAGMDEDTLDAPVAETFLCEDKDGPVAKDFDVVR